MRVSAFLPPESDFEPNNFWFVNVVGCLFSSVDGQVGRYACAGGGDGGGGGDLSGRNVFGE